jgi:uncharacterized protein (TIGR03083 family)
VDVNDAFERATGHFIEVIRGRDWSAPVPTCPGGDVNRIAGHLGTLTVWAEAMVRGNATEPYTSAQVNLDPPDDQDARRQWLEATFAAAAKTFRAAADESPVWTLTPNGTARFWKRRILHELTVHAVDLEIAYRLKIAPIAPDLARDGIDELLELLPYAPRVEGKVGDGAPARLLLAAPDDQWFIDWAPPGFGWHRGHLHESADVRVGARSLQDLYLYAYGRPASRIEIRGDHDVLDRWRLATRL